MQDPHLIASSEMCIAPAWRQLHAGMEIWKKESAELLI